MAFKTALDLRGVSIRFRVLIQQVHPLTEVTLEGGLLQKRRLHVTVCVDVRRSRLLLQQRHLTEIPSRPEMSHLLLRPADAVDEDSHPRVAAFDEVHPVVGTGHVALADDPLAVVEFARNERRADEQLFERAEPVQQRRDEQDIGEHLPSRGGDVPEADAIHPPQQACRQSDDGFRLRLRRYHLVLAEVAAVVDVVDQLAERAHAVVLLADVEVEGTGVDDVEGGRLLTLTDDDLAVLDFHRG